MSGLNGGVSEETPPAGLTDAELRAEAQELGQMIADLFDGVHAGTSTARRVKAIRAGSTVEETRGRMTSLPSLRCRCGQMIRSNDLARAYARHEETCSGRGQED